MKASCLSGILLSRFDCRRAVQPPKKKLLAIGEVQGFEHDSVSHALATIEKLGRQTQLWDTYIRTDNELLTKQKLAHGNAKNLDYFDAVLFYTTGDLGLSDQQKKDLLSLCTATGRSVLITGGATGIGRAAALAFAKEGSRVAIVDIAKTELESLCSEIKKLGGEATFGIGDLSMGEGVKTGVVAALGGNVDRVDVLVNNVGSGFVRTFDQLTDEDWKRFSSTS